MVHRKNVELRAELGAAHVLIEQLRQELGQASRELKACAETLDACRRERGEALESLNECLDLLSEATDHLNVMSVGDIVERSIAFEKKHRPDDTEGEDLRAELDVFVMDSIPPAEAQKALARQGFNALMQDLDNAIATMWGSSGITEMHTTAPIPPAVCRHDGFSHTKNLPCPPPESGLEPLFEKPCPECGSTSCPWPHVTQADVDSALRVTGCECDQEEGDSPCPVHGLNEEMDDDLNDTNDFEAHP